MENKINEELLSNLNKINELNNELDLNLISLEKIDEIEKNFNKIDSLFNNLIKDTKKYYYKK